MTDEPGGQARFEIHRTAAAGGAVQRSFVTQITAARPDETRDGQKVPDTHPPCAVADEAGQSTTETHGGDAGLADTLADLQESGRLYRDHQRLRIVLGNFLAAKAKGAAVYRLRQAGAALPKGRMPKATDRDVALVAEAFPTVLASYAALEQAEKALAKRVKALAKLTPVAAWWCAIRGENLLMLGQVLGETGDLSRFTVSGLWKWFGLHVVDGAAPKRRKGEELGFSIARKTLAIIAADCLIRANSDPATKEPLEYRALYLAEKERFLPRAARPLHAHNHARRLVAKRLLKDLWRAWRAATDRLPTKKRVPPANPTEATSDA